MDKNEAKAPRLFLIYIHEDKPFAKQVLDLLGAHGFKVLIDECELSHGDSIIDAIKQSLSPSDYILVLLSKESVKSKWVQDELCGDFLKTLDALDILTLPVSVDDSEIPQGLRSRQWIDLKLNKENNVRDLVKQLQAIWYLDFSCLDTVKFEHLVADLCTAIGFEKVEKESRVSDYIFDLTAYNKGIDPFGKPRQEYWFIECKFYRQERADLVALRQLVSEASSLPRNSKCLLVTNGQLTSAARNWLSHVNASTEVDLQIIEGPELKRLLLCHNHLVGKYFRERK